MMVGISNRILMLAFLLLSAVAAHADSLNTVLARDLVRVLQDRYVHEQLNRCQVRMHAGSGGAFSKPFTVNRKIEAPQSLLSRDQFVSISTQLFVRNRIAFATIIRPDIEPAEAITAVKCWRIANKEGEIDFRIEVSMAGDGIKFEITDEASGKHSVDQIEWTAILNFEPE